jgi:hypothetical protein
MLDAISMFIHLSFAMMASSSARLIVEGALVYAFVLLPQKETGFYSWHPIWRILAVILLPFVLLYLLLTVGCGGDCSVCCHRCDEDD